MNTAVITASTPASAGQLFEIGNTIASHLAKILEQRGLNKEQATKLIGNKNTLKAYAEQYAEVCFKLAPADSVARYKKDLERFFSTIYGLAIDLTDVAFLKKEGFDHFMIKPAELNADKIYAAFGKAGLPSWKYINGSLVKEKKSEQARPAGTYTFAHKGGAEPDVEHLGKSYDDFITEGVTYLTIDEYMLIEQFMWWKFKLHLDVKGWTRTTTLDSDGFVIRGGWVPGGGRCGLGGDFRDGRDTGDGPRSAVIF